jgi:hypothetical protein
MAVAIAIEFAPGLTLANTISLFQERLRVGLRQRCAGRRLGQRLDGRECKDGGREVKKGLKKGARHRFPGYVA